MMADALLCPPADGAGLPPDKSVEVSQEETPLPLYITLGPEGTFKAGTCAHCVVLEPGRPPRAWNARGDQELDFDRDTLFALLDEFGIQIVDRQAYICP